MKRRPKIAADEELFRHLEAAEKSLSKALDCCYQKRRQRQGRVSSQSRRQRQALVERMLEELSKVGSFSRQLRDREDRSRERFDSLEDARELIQRGADKLRHAGDLYHQDLLEGVPNPREVDSNLEKLARALTVLRQLYDIEPFPDSSRRRKRSSSSPSKPRKKKASKFKMRLGLGPKQADRPEDLRRHGEGEFSSLLGRMIGQEEM